MFKVKDHYYNKAKHENYLARSVYKLEEIDQRFKIIKPSDRVLDLGYYPGSWIQYTTKAVGKSGLVLGIDIQEIQTSLIGHGNVKLFQKDIFNIKSLSDIEQDKLFQVVLSDMAPSTTGIRSLDQDRSLALVESVMQILPLFLAPKGNFVIKVFESQMAQDFLKTQKNRFMEWNYLRPKAIRSVSKEYFVIGKGFKA
jgi:23S rRNA (uridine2552-2'-O)-methyltransferase